MRRDLIFFLVILLVCAAVAGWRSTRVDASFLVTGQTIAGGVLVVAKVPVPTDFNYVCTSSEGYQKICLAFREFVALNKPEVDAILTKYNFRVPDAFDITIFPRP